MSDKPIHAKPSLYAYYFLQLKEIALEYGYNLVLHGSLNRDLDLIAIPWQNDLKDVDLMINAETIHLMRIYGHTNTGRQFSKPGTELTIKESVKKS